MLSLLSSSWLMETIMNKQYALAIVTIVFALLCGLIFLFIK